MAALGKNVFAILGKHAINCPLWWNFCGVNQIRHARVGAGDALTIYPREVNKSKRRKDDKKFQPKEAAALTDEKFLSDILESEFSENLIQFHENESQHSNFRKKSESDALKIKEKLKMQIIKRKFFKAEKEENILTWRAKEQIKFLHMSNPEEWSILSLAGVFPVSVYGVSKIVKSNFIDVSKNEIKRHDKKVLERWREWCDSGIDDDRLSRIMYAAGIPDLPFRKTSNSRIFKNPTPFSDIYKRCVPHDRLLESSENKENDEQVLAFHQMILKDLFSNLEESNKNKKDYVTLKYQKYDAIDKIRVPSTERSKQQVYQKGKTVYDEDGEFLYKIP